MRCQRTGSSMSAEYGNTGWKKPVENKSGETSLHIPHIPSRNTYVEIKVTSEEWWLITFQVWILISFALITRAIFHNVVVGWHCPRNCDAFLTPFALCIATFVVPTCICCPIMGAKGVWWCYIKRKADDDEHRDIHRMRKKCCCVSISWIPSKHPKNQKKKQNHKKLHDSDSVLPSYVKPGTSHDMDRDPGSPGRRREDGSIRLPPVTPRLARIIGQTSSGGDSEKAPEPEPEPEFQQPFDGAVQQILQQAAAEPSTARAAAAQRAVLTGSQTAVDVKKETAPRPLTRERGATIDDMDRMGITQSRRTTTPPVSPANAGLGAGGFYDAPREAPMALPALAPAPAPMPAVREAPMALGGGGGPSAAMPLMAPATLQPGRSVTPPRLGSVVSSASAANSTAANSLLARYRAGIQQGGGSQQTLGLPQTRPGGGGGGDGTMNL